MSMPSDNNPSNSERKLQLCIEFTKFVVGFVAILAIALMGLRAVAAVS